MCLEGNSYRMVSKGIHESYYLFFCLCIVSDINFHSLDDNAKESSRRKSSLESFEINPVETPGESSILASSLHLLLNKFLSIVSLINNIN